MHDVWADFDRADGLVSHNSSSAEIRLFNFHTAPLNFKQHHVDASCLLQTLTKLQQNTAFLLKYWNPIGERTPDVFLLLLLAKEQKFVF